MKRLTLWATSGLLFISLAAPATAQNTTDQPQNGDALTKRVEERKARLKTKLDSAAAKRVADRCKGAQTKLQATSVKVAEANQAVLTKYDAYIKRLETLEQTLASNNVKSSQLLEQIGTLKQKYTALSDSLTALKQAIDDAKAIDCAADPTGFKAAVDDARAHAKTVKAARADLRQYAITTLKPTLLSLKEVN